MKMIHTVGDSHCWHAWLDIPGVKFHLFGPMLMYTFGNTKQIVVNDIPEDDTVIFCWGEIDCRCHVHKHQPWKETIDSLVENYISAIDENAKTHKNAWVFNVVPPPRRKDVPENPGYPFLGTDEERLSYVRYMNQKLKESKYPFIDVYDKYSDKDGFLNLELANEVHIRDNKYLVEWIKKNLKEESRE
jgi:hypothetical protein